MKLAVFIWYNTNTSYKQDPQLFNLKSPKKIQLWLNTSKYTSYAGSQYKPIQHLSLLSIFKICIYNEFSKGNNNYNQM